MMRKTIAVLLSLALVGLSAGLEPLQAMASEVAPVRVNGAGGGAPVVPNAAVGVQLQPVGLTAAPLSGLQGTLRTLPTAPRVTVRGMPAPAALPALAAPVVALPPALPVALAAPQAQTQAATPQTPFQQTIQRLQAPSMVQDVPAQAGVETSADAASRDFAQRLGEKVSVAAALEAPMSVPGLSGLAPATQGKVSAEAVPVSLPAPVQPGKQAKSPVFPAVVAAAAALVWEGIRAAAALCGGAAVQAAGAAPIYTVLQAAAGVAGFTVLGVGAVFAAGALADIGSYAYGMWRGRQVTDADFWDFVRGEVMVGRMDAGVAEMLRVHRPGRISWNMDFGFTANGSIHMRPELAATPWLFRQVLSHELRHLRGGPQRGPPAGRIRGLWRHFVSELSARAGEFKAAKLIARTRIPVLERALRLAQLSLALAKPFDVLVVNAGSPELENPAIYQALSNGQARVSVLKGADPQAVLGDAKNSRRFQAVVLDQSSVLLPEEKSADSQRLSQALEQLDDLFVLATRLVPQTGAFSDNAAHAQRYQSLAVVARGLDPRDKKARDKFEKLVREFWQDIAATRLKGIKAADLMASLYDSMPNKGVAFLPFGPEAAGLPVWEKLLRFWEAKDGGQFRLVRVDLENGGHILILRKVEARVGLWLRPQKGFLAVTIPDADASSEARESARTALSAAGFSDQLAKFDELGVEIRHVFGADVGRQEIYVTVPRRNAGAIRRFVSAAAMDVGASQTNFEPHLFESAELHKVKPVWQAGITGADGTIMWIDTGADKTHVDFEGRLDVVDMVNEGPEDWIGHGTHVAGISISGGTPYTGMAKGAHGIMAKVFSRENPGASDGEIMGAAAIGMQKGVDVINLSLGSKGSSGDNLATFFSQLTHQKNANGDYPFVAASAGNSGPFDQTLSQPAAGEDVFATAAAAVGEDDHAPEISFFSSVGPDVDKRYAVKRVRLKPDATTKGGNVTTEPGSPNVYRLGVYSAKSKDMPKNPSDTADGKHTAMSGTSMASPMLAGIALLVRLALRLTGAETPFVKEHLPLVIKAVIMRTAADMRVPVWFQGAGFVDAWAAVKLVAESVGYVLGNRAVRLWATVKGAQAPPAADAFAWVERYEKVLGLEDKVYSAAELAKTEAKARFDDGAQGDAEDGETAVDSRQASGNAVAAEVTAKFNSARAEVLSDILAALKDPVWLVRRQAALALLNLKTPEAVMPLAEAALQDADARVRQMAFLALAENTSHAADVMLQKAAQNAVPLDVAAYAAYALARHGDRSAVERISAQLASADKAVRFSATWLLGQLGDKASVAEAEALSALVKNTAERGNIRHLAAAALSNVAAEQPAAVSDPVIKDLLEASGPENLALTRTVAKFFPVALRDKALVARLRAEPLKSVVADFVLRNRAAVGRPGALGDLVSLLARVLNIPLDMPTAVPDPSGAGVAGVDPALGDLDVIVGLPEGRELSAYRGGSAGAAESLAEAGLAQDILGKFSAGFQAGLPVSRTLWLSVPAHKFFALSLELRHAGYSVSLSQPEHSLSRASRGGGAPAAAGLTMDLTDGVPALGPGADLSLIRLTAQKSVSEAKVMAALESIRAQAGDPLQKPVVVSVSLGSQATPGSGVLAGLIDRLLLDNIGVVLPAGNEGPAEGSVSALAKGSLAVVVAAAGNTEGLESYSARGSAQAPAISWADLVDDLGSALPSLRAAAESAARAILGEDPSAPAEGSKIVAVGTGAAAERTAEKLALMARRMAEVFAAQKTALPSGYFFYIADLVQRSLSPLPGRSSYETGGGVFDHPEKAMELLETRLLDPVAAQQEALALSEAARARYRWNRAAGTPAQAAHKAVFSAAQAVAGQMMAQPRLIAAAAELSRRLGGRDLRFPTVTPQDGLAYVRQLRAVLASGTQAAGGAITPFVFRKASGGTVAARAAGLEGFLYAKLELSRAGALDLGQLGDYFRYLQDLLAGAEWTKALRRDIEKIRTSDAAAAEKNRRLDERLLAAVREYQTELRAADASNWFRGAGIYELSSRDYESATTEKKLFDLLDEAELRRIQSAARVDTLLLKTGFAGGAEEAFRRLVRRAHSLGLKVAVEWTGPKAFGDVRAADLGVDVVRRGRSYFVAGQELGQARGGLQEALASRDADRIRAALQDAAFRAWQRGGPAEVEAALPERTGRFWKAALLMASLLRPLVLEAGKDAGGASAENEGEFMRSVSARSADYRDLLERGAMEVLDTNPGTPVVAYTLSAASGARRKTVLAAANFGPQRGSGQFRFKAAQSGLDAFAPAAGKTYTLRDLANQGSDGQPVTYTRSGQELLEKGLYIELDSGGVHFFEVEEAR